MRDELLHNAFRRPAGIIRMVGHLGTRGLFEANSIFGFDNIKKIGVTPIELDVVFSKDKTPLITHNHIINQFLTREVDGQFVKIILKLHH